MNQKTELLQKNWNNWFENAKTIQPYLFSSNKKQETWMQVLQSKLKDEKKNEQEGIQKDLGIKVGNTFQIYVN